MPPAISSSFIRIPLLFATCLTLCFTSACKTFDAGRAVADVLFPVAEENALGKQLKAEIEKEVTRHKNSDVQKYVSGIGKKNRQKSDRHSTGNQVHIHRD